MPKDDDLLFALGALVLGLGLYHLITRPTARAYAVTAPCAAACAPFKNSPGTYATCCKQHAATAKPAVKPKTATKVYPSLASKPQSTNNLIEKVSLIDPWYSKPANITNYNIYPNQTVPRNPYTTSIRGGAPSGGGNVWPGIRCQTGCNQACGTGGCKSNESMRIQYGVKQVLLRLTLMRELLSLLTIPQRTPLLSKSEAVNIRKAVAGTATNSI